MGESEHLLVPACLVTPQRVPASLTLVLADLEVPAGMGR
jgi:hypothetical protein